MTRHASEKFDMLACDLDRRLKLALQRWGRCASTNYPAFQPIVTLDLQSVEALAINLVSQEKHPRPIDDGDRQRAVWYLVCQAILSLQPPPLYQPAPVRAAIEKLRSAPWPQDLAVPAEYHHYLVLHLAYVTRTHANKQIAALLRVSIRTVAIIRNQAIAMVARRLADWELSEDELDTDQMRLFMRCQVPQYNLHD